MIHSSNSDGIAFAIETGDDEIIIAAQLGSNSDGIAFAIETANTEADACVMAGSNSDGIAFAIETLCQVLWLYYYQAPTVTESLSRLKHPHSTHKKIRVLGSNSDGIAFAIETTRTAFK